MRGPFADMKRTFDPAEYGGSPFLGISKPVVKAHGSSDAKAFSNAIRQAITCVNQGVVDIIATDAARLAEEERSGKK